MTWHWTGLVFFSLALLPPGLALVSGRIPLRLRHRLAPCVRAAGPFSASAPSPPLTTIPRLAEAPPETIVVATAAAAVLAAASWTYAALAPRRPRNVAR
ncbi:hypothetical protein QF037_009360 [Streptomyces canus]|uniref:hypothetical protein n=1 Tax=Streptomyces canus TaxID=58343 RepID=UPI002788206F|nr:hypothetical protein [Streptomyces canus]MDQ0605015.1 hypothetical protein [Streptomyces canus]